MTSWTGPNPVKVLAPGDAAGASAAPPLAGRTEDAVTSEAGAKHNIIRFPMREPRDESKNPITEGA